MPIPLRVVRLSMKLEISITLRLKAKGEQLQEIGNRAQEALQTTIHHLYQCLCSTIEIGLKTQCIILHHCSLGYNMPKYGNTKWHVETDV